MNRTLVIISVCLVLAGLVSKKACAVSACPDAADVKQSDGQATNAVGGAVQQVTATITDDDPQPTVTLSLTGSPLAEASGAATVRATLSATSALPVTAWFDFSGTATLTSDYTRTATNITIAAGATSGTLTLWSVQDARDETNETIVVTLAGVSNGLVATPSQVTAVITDDDPPPSVTLVAPDVRWLAEGNGSAAVIASLSAASALPVTVTLNFSGTATPLCDYAYMSLDIAIPAGSLSGTNTLRAVQDALIEGAETVEVTIAAAVNGTFSGLQRVTLMLADDDQHWVGVGDRVILWTNSVSADRVRLGVRDEGVYRVTAGEIAAASGATTNAVLAALATDGLALSCQGREVAWATHSDALFFYGVATTELFAPENVYWLDFGPGERMEAFSAAPEAGAATNQWFLRAESFRSAFLAPWEPRDRRSTNGSLTNVLNFGEWIQGKSEESLRAKEKTVALPGFCATAATGVVARVSVVSYRDFASPDNHSCELWLNGTACGSTNWSGEQAVVFEVHVPIGVVTNGLVKVKIRNGFTAQVNDFMLLDVTLNYPCEYLASAGLLRCTGGPDGTVTARGFGSEQFRVWDVTEPDAPLELEAARGTDTNGTWKADFLCGGVETLYAVFDEAAGTFSPSVSGVRHTVWSDPAEMPELAIVIPPRRWVTGFDAAVRPLAEFRAAQGLRTRVIDAEELYNAFTDGLAHPAAFQLFSVAGGTNGPSQTLRYLLFAGYGSSDYKLEVFGFGEKGPYPALFPLYLYSQVDEVESAALLLPNDTVLGNARGGARPEVAVGRFIATNAVELTRMVNKTIGYELTATWKNKAIFTADWQNIGEKYVNFTGIASNAATKFSAAEWALETFYPGPADSNLGPFWRDTYYGTGAYYELVEGAGFFYFVGHSNDSLMGATTANKLFDNTMLRLADWPFAPVALLLGCRMGRWTVLDVRTQPPCIAEAGVRNPFSGFAAVISAAGYLDADDAILFSDGFGDRVAAGAVRLGDAWLGGFDALGDAYASNVQHMTFLGDPSLCIRAGFSARGTPSAWLLEQGQTEAGADLLDPDEDGFATWREYQAGTSPTQRGLRFRTLTLPEAGAEGLPLAFEVIAGSTNRVVMTTNLCQGAWTVLPWRPATGGAWSWSGIPGDTPLKEVEVPYDPAVRQQFFKIEAFGGE